MADDKTLSETILKGADALSKWKEMEPVANELTSLVKEYSEIIDGVSSAFAVVGFFWNIYSSMEKAKDNTARQQEMVQQITSAVDGMISRATADVKHHFNQAEVKAAVTAANAVQEGFRDDVLPYAKTFPLTGFDMGPLELLINDARKVIGTLRSLLEERAKDGDGAAIVVLYRSLQAVVQCKLTMDKWRRGLVPEVVAEAERQLTRLVTDWVLVVRGFQRMSDLSFSQGIVYFSVGGGGRPAFNKYSYLHKGKTQPVSGSDKVPVVQAFIAAREAGRRDPPIPKGLYEWNKHSTKIFQQVLELRIKV